MKQPKKTQRQSSIPVWLICLFIASLTCLVYSAVTKAGFIWDDTSMLTDNVFVKAKNGLQYIWFSTALPDYFPLTSTSLWLEWQLWGPDPFPYHLTNVLLHATSSILLWRVLRQLNIPGALLAAVLFAVHPVNVESVAWIAERKNTLALPFYLLAILFFLKSSFASEAGPCSVNGDRPSRRFYFLSLGMFLLSLLSKTSGVMLPLVLLLCIWWRERKVTRQDLICVLPFFGIALVLGLVTIWFQYHRAIGNDLFVHRSFGEKLAGAGLAVWFYLWKVLWPLNLSFVYAPLNISSPVFSYLPGVLFLGSLFAAWRCSAAWGRAVCFALLYFVVTLFPVLGFFKIYFQRYSLVADHWQYFSMLSVVALLSAALMSLRSGSGRGLQKVIAVAVVGALSFASWRQAHIYQNKETLWRDCLTKNPDGWLAYNNWGFELAAEGKNDAAVELYLKSIAIQPQQIESYNNLGALYLAQGKLVEAMTQFQEALRQQPEAALTHHNIGNVLDRQGHAAEAIAEYNEALRLDPYQADAQNNLACNMVLAGKAAEAVESFKRVLQLKPDHLDALNNIGSTLVEQGRAAEAIEYLQHAVEIKPAAADPHYNLGNALLALNKVDEAADQYRMAITANTNMALAHYKLGSIYFRQRKGPAAAEEFIATLRIDPNHAEAHYQLSILLQLANKMDDAVAHLKATVQLKPDWVEAVNNLAWINATHKSALYRDGDEAIRLAQHAVDLTQHKDPAVLDTLAAAYAQDREFEKAITTVQAALDLTRPSNNTNAIQQLEGRLQLYQSGKPYRDQIR